MATVTDACVDYEGSMTTSKDLMDQAGMAPYEKILCGNMANGQRFETTSFQVRPDEEKSSLLEPLLTLGSTAIDSLS